MPKPNNHKQIPVEPDAVPAKDISSQEIEIDNEDASTENLSEVTQRINLLGKLVIPPSNP